MQSTKNLKLATNKERLAPLLLIFTLALISLFALTNYPKYIVSGDELLKNPSFSEDLTNWEKSGKSSAFLKRGASTVLSQTSNKQSSRLIQRVTGEELAGTYSVEAQLGSNNIIAGTKDWQNGALVLIRENKENQRTGSIEIVGMEGTQALSMHQKFIEIPAPTPKINLTVRILEASGELLVGSISLKPATEQTHHKTLRAVLITAWASLALILFVMHLRRFGITTAFVLLCTIGVLALIGTLMPKQLSIDLSASIASFLPDQLTQTLRQMLDYAFPGYIGHNNQEISKLGHWAAFFALTTTAILLLRKTPIAFVVTSILVLAATTETLQFLTSARTPHIYDFFIDAAGCLAGLLIAWPIRWVTRPNLHA